MNLYNITYGKPKVYRAEDIEEFEYIQAIMNKMHAKTFDKILRTIDEAIADTAKTRDGKLVWTKTGALLGFSSDQPHKDIEHLWAKVAELMGDGKELLKCVGSLVLWRIALRAESCGETWLWFQQDSDTYDKDTGKKIKISTYWINNDFQGSVAC